MLPKTSRDTGESSCHCRTVATIPDATVTTANATPMTTATWRGRMRTGAGRSVPFAPASASASASAVLTVLTPPKLPNGAPPLRTCGGWGGYGPHNHRKLVWRGLAERLAVELADAAGQGGEDLVGERGDLVEQPRELARAQHEDGERRGGDDAGGAGSVVEQRHLAHAVTRAQPPDLLTAAPHLGLALDDDERLAPDVALGDELPALVDVQLDGGLGDRPQLPGRGPREQGHGRQVVQVLVPCH